jgi:hypothetical protein
MPRPAPRVAPATKATRPDRGKFVTMLDSSHAASDTKSDTNMNDSRFIDHAATRFPRGRHGGILREKRSIP